MIINCILLIVVSVNTISGGVIKESSKSIFTGRELKQICKSIQSNVNSGVDPVKSQANIFNEYSSKLGSTTDSTEKLKKLEAEQNALKFKRLLKAFTKLIGTFDELNNGLQVKQEDETSTVIDGESNFQDGNSETDDQVKPSEGDNEEGNGENEVDIDDNDHDDDDDDDEGDEDYDDEFDVCEFIDYPDGIDLSEVEYGDLDSGDYDIYEYDFEPFGLSLNLRLAVSH
ncbi:phosphopantothenoylcysteine decarboxylase subunit VHS3-like [Tetranychus urticae]|nr:phosphopantothenoylcysteine decarboxylase subunit VHS3-like [Tetranychus urticae]